MSINYRARVVYGVPTDLAKVYDLCDNNKFDRDELFDRWVIKPDFVYGSDRFIIGFCVGVVEEGEFAEFDEPPEEDVDELCEMLKHLGIKEKPRWFLMCQIS